MQEDRMHQVGRNEDKRLCVKGAGSWVGTSRQGAAGAGVAVWTGGSEWHAPAGRAQRWRGAKPTPSGMEGRRGCGAP